MNAEGIYLLVSVSLQEERRPKERAFHLDDDDTGVKIGGKFSQVQTVKAGAARCGDRARSRLHAYTILHNFTLPPTNLN